MKLGYYNPQLKFAQVKKDGKVAGTLLLIHKAYGYNVQLHYFNVPGYSIDRYFSTQEKAEAFFDKTLSEASEK